ncbi:hypothetical protein SAMN02745823_01959 [Sporobacter termitidis DSM 10068]|uniref:Uncharacterized protein n=1 Tax=Sporobacter termitidis DSM 10068 TaxID=1123282 RepID=A0A1M5XR22_9FIRM|nr:hypothetical protein SAMN02745823_01959 [Sporobacter termitidis DSM 10068]
MTNTALPWGQTLCPPCNVAALRIGEGRHEVCPYEGARDGGPRAEHVGGTGRGRRPIVACLRRVGRAIDNRPYRHRLGFAPWECLYAIPFPAARRRKRTKRQGPPAPPAPAIYADTPRRGDYQSPDPQCCNISVRYISYRYITRHTLQPCNIAARRIGEGRHKVCPYEGERRKTRVWRYSEEAALVTASLKSPMLMVTEDLMSEERA